VPEVTVNVKDVFPYAVSMGRTKISVGDTVFDTFGGTYTVKKVTRYPAYTRCVRSDGTTFIIPGDSTIPAVPKGDMP
jgi:hypothetical protein